MIGKLRKYIGIVIIEILVIIFIIIDSIFYKSVMRTELLVLYLQIQTIFLLVSIKYQKVLRYSFAIAIMGIVLLGVYFKNIPKYTFNEAYNLVLKENETNLIDKQILYGKYFPIADSCEMSEKSLFVDRIYMFYSKKEGEFKIIAFNPNSGERFDLPIMKLNGTE